MPPRLTPMLSDLHQSVSVFLADQKTAKSDNWKPIATLHKQLAKTTPGKGQTLRANLQKEYAKNAVTTTAHLGAVHQVLLTLAPIIRTRTEAKKRSRQAMEAASVETRPGIASSELKYGNDVRYIWDHTGIVLPNDTPVAALVDADSKPQLWILVKVIGHSVTAGQLRYDVLDEDSQNKKRYTLSSHKVIPVYSLLDYDLTERVIFPKETRVLALFPSDGVTTFYPAMVKGIPTKSSRGQQTYDVEFEDDDEPTRKVEPIYVLPVPAKWDTV
jgi:hypothetical protein